VKIGLYGGTFDPIHTGHILPVHEARRAFDLERVIYLPTGEPPHKVGNVVASAQARFAMVELALLWEPDLVVSTFELSGPGPRYTVDTVDHFQRQAPDDEIVLLLGSDAFAAFDRWRDWQRILEMAQIGILLRPGWDREQLRATLAQPLLDAIAAGRVRFAGNRPVSASSSELRQQLANQATPSPIPRLVLDYARKYELYR